MPVFNDALCFSITCDYKVITHLKILLNWPTFNGKMCSNIVVSPETPDKINA